MGFKAAGRYEILELTQIQMGVPGVCPQAAVNLIFHAQPSAAVMATS